MDGGPLHWKSTADENSLRFLVSFCLFRFFSLEYIRLIAIRLIASHAPAEAS